MTPHDRTAVTAVIAAKNEADSVGQVVRATLAHACRVLVVDGHSSDGTAAVAREAGAEFLEDHGLGKGDAMKTGAARVKTSVTVFLDADGSHDPADIPSLVAPILDGTADHVSASRLRGGSSEFHGGFDEFARLAGSAFVTAWINMWFGARISDSQNGFRAIRTEVFRALGVRANSTTIEQEMIMRTLRCGFRLAEVPSHEHARVAGRSHISVWRATVPYAWSLTLHSVFGSWRRGRP